MTFSGADGDFIFHPSPSEDGQVALVVFSVRLMLFFPGHEFITTPEDTEESGGLWVSTTSISFFGDMFSSTPQWQMVWEMGYNLLCYN